MATLATYLSNPPLPTQIRPINPRRDLSRVADLIEMCFEETLDPDGRNYLKRMRQVSRKSGTQWFDPPAFFSNLTTDGFVWQENGEVQGNISLIPFVTLGRSIYLIANVAVHPDYRQKGIARALTIAALTHAARRRVRSVWLQVRANNDPAVKLYESLGFKPKAHRTTWTLLPGKLNLEAPTNARIIQHQARHWKKHRKWLRHNYPDDLFWYWSISPNAFRPGVWGALIRLLFETQVRQWGVEKNGELLGILSWKTTRSYADQLWLAAPPGNEETVLRTLLPHIHWRGRNQRPLSIDLPIGRVAQIFQASGFQPHQTLIWMAL
jgi:GNAT superfamily N-acetyltransferase